MREREQQDHTRERIVEKKKLRPRERKTGQREIGLEELIAERGLCGFQGVKGTRRRRTVSEEQGTARAEGFAGVKESERAKRPETGTEVLPEAGTYLTQDRQFVEDGEFTQDRRLASDRYSVERRHFLNCIQFPVAMARGFHLFPFRTQQLSLFAPMVLGW